MCSEKGRRKKLTVISFTKQPYDKKKLAEKIVAHKVGAMYSMLSKIRSLGFFHGKYFGDKILTKDAKRRN